MCKILKLTHVRAIFFVFIEETYWKDKHKKVVVLVVEPLRYG